jgi:hypothetical protein
MKRVMAASGSGFIELRGQFKRTENGTGVSPLFRVRKVYEGSFLFGGASSAELEEVYYRKDGRPSYNYRLFFQSPFKESAEKYDELMIGLQQMLIGFEHTHASGYDAWARSDAAGTAVLLSVQEQSGLLQVQIHVAFPTPKWWKEWALSGLILDLSKSYGRDVYANRLVRIENLDSAGSSFDD